MENRENKIDSELLRWVRKEPPNERTVIIRLTFSKNPEEAAEMLGKIGMGVQSHGPSVVVATSGYVPVIEAIKFSWVVSIELPRQRDMKSRLDMT